MAQRAVLDENSFPGGHVRLLGAERPSQRETREGSQYDSMFHLEVRPASHDPEREREDAFSHATF